MLYMLLTRDTLVQRIKYANKLVTVMLYVSMMFDKYKHVYQGHAENLLNSK